MPYSNRPRHRLIHPLNSLLPRSPLAYPLQKKVRALFDIVYLYLNGSEEPFFGHCLTDRGRALEKRVFHNYSSHFKLRIWRIYLP